MHAYDPIVLMEASGGGGKNSDKNSDKNWKLVTLTSFTFLYCGNANKAILFCILIIESLLLKNKRMNNYS